MVSVVLNYSLTNTGVTENVNQANFDFGYGQSLKDKRFHVRNLQVLRSCEMRTSN